MLRQVHYYLFSSLLLILFVLTPKTPSTKLPQTVSIKAKIVSKPCNCDSLWLKPETKAFVEALENTTSNSYNIWRGYNVQDGIYILNAGINADSLYCLGLWKTGKKVDTLCSRDVPKLLTPLYSYYLNYETPIRQDSIFFKTANESPHFDNWMRAHHIESAIYMPTLFPKFPFKIPAKTKAQLAIHEAFHTEVMLKYWYTGKAKWPKWDHQPDRKNLPTCYTYNPTVSQLITEEQVALAKMLESLIIRDRKNAIKLGNDFLDIRKRRYAELETVKIDLKTGIYGDCETAEAMMEIEEGLADYASWSIMYEMGIFTKEELIKRYNAKQKAKYYLLGSMMMHAMCLMNGDPNVIIDSIITSKSVESGNLTFLFSKELEQYKNQ
ncbi:hypothetical protein [Winogradskyella sp.]|uniref:hypothetical protein n=1 Tax=Winogradskyella sp. TaxID=1883156 RepID=UPI00260241CA|nr:hypothetical protein [Winogradskyella sp.]